MHGWGGQLGLKQTSARLEDSIARQQVVLIQAKSEAALARFDDGVFDWVYIDTDHSYQLTSLELDLCCRKVKPGGIIAGHDYIAWEYSNPLNRYGVIEAVAEFCVTRQWEMIYLTNESHRHLSFALRQMQ